MVIGGGYDVSADPAAIENLTPIENRPTSDTVWTVSGDNDGVGRQRGPSQAFAVCALVTP